MNRKVFCFVLSWCVLLGGLAGLFCLRNSFGPVATQDAIPVITQVKVKPDGKVYFAWECYNTTVTSYRLYSYNGKGLALVKAVGAATTYYNHSEAEKGQPISYTVIAANVSQNPTALSQRSEYSLTVVPYSGKGIPADLSGADVTMLAAVQDADGVMVEWEPVYNVPFSSYQVMRRPCGGDIWEQIAHVSSFETSYRDSTCEVGDTYEYAVHACSEAAGEMQKSTCSEPISVKFGGAA